MNIKFNCVNHHLDLLPGVPRGDMPCEKLCLCLVPPNHLGLDGLKLTNMCSPHSFFLSIHLLPFLILPLSFFPSSPV